MSKSYLIDKNTTKWFILLPSGHVGPYSLSQVIELFDRKKISLDVKIWAEGLTEPINLNEVLVPKEKIHVEMPVKELEEDNPPPIPSAEFLRSVPVKQTTSTKLNRTIFFNRWVSLALILFASVIFLNVFWFEPKNFYIGRLDKMSPEIHQRIIKENKLSQWGKEIFFREYVSEDYSRIWLISTSHHRCEVETTLKSLDGKLLSLEDKKIIFRAQGKLSSHVVNLSSFHFLNGSRILPGMYEMDVRAYECDWDGIIPFLMNGFTFPEKEYFARTKVILHPKGPEEFNVALGNILKRKQTKQREREVTKIKHKDLLQENLVQKFNTLEAVSSQIEQHFLKFLSNHPKEIQKKMNVMINSYSKNFGYFLTSFVVENENDFKNIPKNNFSAWDNKEAIRLTSKKIGFESMKFIEEIQKIKKAPSKQELKKLADKIEKAFSSIKKEINQKLSQVSQDPENE